MKKRSIVPVPGTAAVSIERAKAVATSIKAVRGAVTGRLVTPSAQQKYLGHISSTGTVVKRAKKKLAAGRSQ